MGSRPRHIRHVCQDLLYSLTAFQHCTGKIKPPTKLPLNYAYYIPYIRFDNRRKVHWVKLTHYRKVLMGIVGGVSLICFTHTLSTKGEIDLHTMFAERNRIIFY